MFSLWNLYHSYILLTDFVKFHPFLCIQRKKETLNTCILLRWKRTLFIHCTLPEWNRYPFDIPPVERGPLLGLSLSPSLGQQCDAARHCFRLRYLTFLSSNNGTMFLIGSLIFSPKLSSPVAKSCNIKWFKVSIVHFCSFTYRCLEWIFYFLANAFVIRKLATFSYLQWWTKTKSPSKICLYTKAFGRSSG